MSKRNSKKRKKSFKNDCRITDAASPGIERQSPLPPAANADPPAWSPAITLGQWLDQWLTLYARPRVKQLTWESYEDLIRLHIKPVIGHIPLRDLRPVHLQRLYNEKLYSGRIDCSGGLSPKTVALLHGILHQSLRQAVREELITRNVADAVSKPRQNKYKIRPLDVEELNRFLNTAKGHWLFPAFLLEWGTGLRRGELLGVRWADIDWANGAVTVNRSLVRSRLKGLIFEEPKTETSRRTIPLPEEVLRELVAHKNRQEKKMACREDDPVFRNPRGRPVDPRSFTRNFKLLLQQAGLPPVRFHDMRHSHATILLLLGENAKVISERLGHSKISMTLDTYSHVLPGMQEKASAKLNNVLNLEKDKR